MSDRVPPFTVGRTGLAMPCVMFGRWGAARRSRDVCVWPLPRITEQSGDLWAEMQFSFLCLLRDEIGTWLWTRTGRFTTSVATAE